jgi:hypothetical protein
MRDPLEEANRRERVRDGQRGEGRARGGRSGGAAQRRLARQEAPAAHIEEGALGFGGGTEIRNGMSPCASQPLIHRPARIQRTTAFQGKNIQTSQFSAQTL